MTSRHRLIAISVVWLALMWITFFSNNPFMPASSIPTLDVIYLAAALLATFIIMRAGGQPGSS